MLVFVFLQPFRETREALSANGSAVATMDGWGNKKPWYYPWPFGQRAVQRLQPVAVLLLLAISDPRSCRSTDFHFRKGLQMHTQPAPAWPRAPHRAANRCWWFLLLVAKLVGVALIGRATACAWYLDALRSCSAAVPAFIDLMCGRYARPSDEHKISKAIALLVPRLPISDYPGT
jgi:hypothetical protein